MKISIETTGTGIEMQFNLRWASITAAARAAMRAFLAIVAVISTTLAAPEVIRLIAMLPT